MADINKELINKLFESFESANADWKKAKAEVEVVYARQSDIVKQISEAIHPAKKIRWRGQELTIVYRPFKDGSGGSYFFRGLKSDDDIVEVG